MNLPRIRQWTVLYWKAKGDEGKTWLDPPLGLTTVPQHVLTGSCSTPKPLSHSTEWRRVHTALVMEVKVSKGNKKPSKEGLWEI